MLSDKLVEHLKSENELLQLQLQDVNYMISIREEELESLRKTAAHAVELQSRLDMNLDEFYQMQDQVGSEQERAEGAERRELSLENELLQSIQVEKESYQIKSELASVKAAFADITTEVEQMGALYKEIAELTFKVSALQSNLDIANMENDFLKEEVNSFKKSTDEGKAEQ